jgi:hypothetical protein
MYLSASTDLTCSNSIAATVHYLDRRLNSEDLDFHLAYYGNSLLCRIAS